MPVEVFLTTVVSEADTTKARSVIHGFTETRSVTHRYTRVRHLRRLDLNVRGIPILKSLQQSSSNNPSRPDSLPQWQELHTALSRQQYMLTERLDVTQEVEAAMTTGQAVPLSEQTQKGERMMRWNDFPDPPNPRVAQTVMQRKQIEIREPGSLLEQHLADSGFSVYNEYIEEAYHWWHNNNLEFVLWRQYYDLPQQPLSMVQAPDQPVWSVPDLSKISPVSPFWMLNVRALVDATPVDKMAERMAEAHAKLGKVEKDLEGVFSFMVFDRRALDTRYTGEEQQ
ncbi:mediator complex, subunit Med18 [Sordaria brevicollis]|uniref:Mediator of RNA polymerase II transcription subunit 18 n=1 Tax=Sordaria brevicollis TaxID=83679 RepID=A0AAE0P2M0_SORBR|nr:mediator complex, subunit Med18 [Sordaria brevicollis]